LADKVKINMYKIPEEESSVGSYPKEQEFMGKESVNGILSTRTDCSAQRSTPKSPCLASCASKDDLMFVNFMRVASQYNIPSVDHLSDMSHNSHKAKYTMSNSKIEHLLDTMAKELQQEFKDEISTSRLLDLSGTYIYNPAAEAEITRLRNELNKHKRVMGNLMKGLKDVGKAYVESTQFTNHPPPEGNTPMDRIISLVHTEFGLDPACVSKGRNQDHLRHQMEQAILSYVSKSSSELSRQASGAEDLRYADNTESFVDIHSMLSPCPSSQYILNKDRDQSAVNEMMPQTFCFTTDSMLKDLICPKDVLQTSRAWENDADISFEAKHAKNMIEPAKEDKGTLVSQYFKKKQNCSLSYSVTGGSLPNYGAKSITNENSPPRDIDPMLRQKESICDGSPSKDWSLLHSELLQKIDVAIIDCRNAYTAMPSAVCKEDNSVHEER
jgi:hypothetical protein